MWSKVNQVFITVYKVYMHWEWARRWMKYLYYTHTWVVFYPCDKPLLCQRVSFYKKWAELFLTQALSSKLQSPSLWRFSSIFHIEHLIYLFIGQNIDCPINITIIILFGYAFKVKHSLKNTKLDILYQFVAKTYNKIIFAILFAML